MSDTNLSMRWLDCLKEVELATKKMGELVRALIEQEVPDTGGVFAHRLSWLGKTGEPGIVVRVVDGSYFEVDFIKRNPNEHGSASWACEKFEDPTTAAQFITGWLKLEKA